MTHPGIQGPDPRLGHPQATKPSPSCGIGGPGPSASLSNIILSPGHTPLHVAVIHKDAEMVRLLWEAGADLNKLVSLPREEVWQVGGCPRVGQGPL